MILIATQMLPVSENVGLVLTWIWVVLCVVVTVPAIKTTLFEAPLVVSKKGVSLRGKPCIPWYEIEEISIFLSPVVRFRDQTIALRFFLTDSAKTPSDGLIARGLLNKNRAMVQLPLYITEAAFEQQELIGALAHFGLDRIDPAAAQRLRSTATSSGLIQHSSADEPELENFKDEAKTYYLSNGFHIDH